MSAKKRLKLNIAGINVDLDVKSVEEIHASRCNIMAVRLKSAGQLNQYPVGTKSGFKCSKCGADCILASSGQQIVAAGLNPIVCMECVAESVRFDMKVKLVRASVCPCGYPLMDTPVGTIYRAISGSKRPGTLRCGGCNQILPVTLITCEQILNPDQPPAALVFDAVELIPE